MTAIPVLPFPVGKGDSEVSENDNEDIREEKRSGRDRRSGSDDEFVDRAKAANTGLAIIKNFITAIVLLIGFGASIGIQIANNRTTAEKIEKFDSRIEALSNLVHAGDTARQLTAKDDDNRYGRLKDKVDAHDNALGMITNAYQYNLNSRVSTIEGRLGLPVRSLPPPAVTTTQP